MAGVRSSGTILILLSAAAFGAMAVFGTLAYGEGATAGTLLTVRFVLAALIWWTVLLATRAGAAELRSLDRRDAVLALGLGACAYAAQAGGYFTALERIDASLLSLLVYSYPAIVAVAAVVLGRERLDRRRLLALALTLSGLVLVLAGAGTGALEPLGIALGIGTALVYSAYLLASEGISARVPPRALAAVVCTGAGATLTVAAAALGELRPGAVSAAGWGWLACLAVVSTVAAVALFFAGLRRVGPTTAAIVSTAEPLVTVVLATIVFAQALGPVQVLGGALMLAGVLALHLRRPGSLRACIHRSISADGCGGALDRTVPLEEG
jgi:drug/metabolite transporter (DMT)-like permease